MNLYTLLVFVSALVSWDKPVLLARELECDLCFAILEIIRMAGEKMNLILGLTKHTVNQHQV